MKRKLLLRQETICKLLSIDNEEFLRLTKTTKIAHSAKINNTIYLDIYDFIRLIDYCNPPKKRLTN